MKTLLDIKNEVAKEMYDCTFLQACTFIGIIGLEGLMNEVAKQYATEAIKSDREKTVKSATIALRVNINGQGHPVVDKESILNLPIELP